MADTPTTDVNDAAIDAVFTEEDQDTSEAAPSTEENKPDVEEAPKAEDPKPEEPTETDNSEEQNETEEPQTEETEKPQGKAEERKQQLNTEIRDLVSQRNALKSEVEKINSQVYQPATEEELQQQGLTPEMAAIESMKQREEMRDFNTQVADAQLTLESESSRVMQDFPMFNPESDQFNADLANRGRALLNQSLIHDPNSGQVIGSNFSPYQIFETLAAAHQTSAAQGQIKGQKATEQMLASADPSTSSSPPKSKKDPVQAILEDTDGI